MAEYRKAFSCEIVTPEGPLGTFETVGVVLPAVDGQLGILGGRSALATMVGVGLLAIESKAGSKKGFFVERGFAQMESNVLTILAERCRPIQTVDPEEAWEELARANRMPAETREQIAARDSAVDVARRKFRILQTYRRKKRGPGATTADTVADADWD